MLVLSMKRYYLLFVVALFSLQLIAQRPALPLVEEGRVWHLVSLYPEEELAAGMEGENFYRDFLGRPCTGYPYELILKGDTVLDGRSYKKLVRTDNQRFISGLRQEGNRVYEYITTEDLIFDFDLQEGDQFTSKLDHLTKMRVGHVWPITVNGIERRVLAMWAAGENVVDDDSSLVDYWIEGVGCMNGPHFPLWWSATGVSSLLLDCKQDGQLIVTWEDVKASIPSGVSSVSLSTDSTSSLGLHDLQGRRLAAPPAKGVYIQDGRKVLK